MRVREHTCPRKNRGSHRRAVGFVVGAWINYDVLEPTGQDHMVRISSRKPNRGTRYDGLRVRRRVRIEATVVTLKPVCVTIRRVLEAILHRADLVPI